MRNELAKTYREINIMLDLLGDAFKKRLPKTMIPFFEEYEDKNYNPKITLDKNGFSKNLQTDTYVLMSMMYINYWCEDPNEKEELKRRWMNPGKNGDYDVFSQNAYKNSLGINVATAKYKDVQEDSTKDGEIEVDMNKYGNLFDNVKDSPNNLIENKTVSKFSKAKTIIGKFTSSLKGLIATFGRK